MSSQSSGSGRRRLNLNEKQQYSAEDEALNIISNEAETKLAAKRAARAEAREIRLKELEKQQNESDVKQDSAAVKVRQQLSGSRSGSRRGSAESNDSDAKDTDFKKRSQKLTELRELEMKYKSAMVTSAQLDNEKQALVYQVELLKDQLEEQDEQHTELQREFKEKSRQYDFAKRDLESMEHQLNILRQQLEIKDTLIERSGFVILTNEKGEPIIQKSSQTGSSNGPAGTLLVSAEMQEVLRKTGGVTLDDKVRSLAKEKDALQKEIQALKSQIDEHQINGTAGEFSSNISQMNGPEMQLYEIQHISERERGEASKQIHEYKFKLQKAEQDIATLEGMVTRLDTQVKRFKGDAERAEEMEDELKQEKRKLQKELREAVTELEELQDQNKNLTARLERIRQNRTALSIQ